MLNAEFTYHVDLVVETCIVMWVFVADDSIRQCEKPWSPGDGEDGEGGEDVLGSCDAPHQVAQTSLEQGRVAHTQQRHKTCPNLGLRFPSYSGVGWALLMIGDNLMK